MKRIWAPWRMDYVEGKTKESGCIFCRRAAMDDDSENLILHRGKHAFVILNLYPYTNGHTMVVPYMHKASLEDLDETTRNELMQLTTEAVTVLQNVYNAENFNIGINIGEAAGAGIAEHIHVHIVPRWTGDTSFMTTSGDTRVLPESLDQSYQRLHAEWLKIKADPRGQ
jgi:ATP adenylyltransferase